nr:hypothetical protein [Tanacetum cinerariifolium]
VIKDDGWLGVHEDGLAWFKFELILELDIVDGDDVRDHIEVDPRYDREEFEASVVDTVVLGMDPRSVPMIDEEIIEPSRGDSSSSFSTKDGTIRSVKDMLVDLDDAIHYFYHHMSERDCVDSVRLHMSRSQEEFRQIHDDRDDLRRKLRTMTNTRSGMTPTAIKEMINRCMAEALEAHEINMNLKLENRNRNGGNGNGNGGNKNGNAGNGQNVARAYTTGNNETRDYEGLLPYCNRCKLHHEGQCTMKYSNCKRVRNETRDGKVALVVSTQGTPRPNQRVNTCFECGAPGHYLKDCPKIKNQNCGNKARIPKARGKAYALGGGDANLGSNTVTGTFLLNDHHAYMLFDSDVDRHFVSNTFSTVLDITPFALDVIYAIELSDKSTLKTSTMVRGCTLGLLGHPINIDLMPIDLVSFDVLIGMDWLAKNHTVIVCDEKIVRIPYRNKILIVQGD